MQERRDDRRAGVLEQRLADDWVIVAEERRTKAQLEVHDLTTVLIPQARAFAAREIPRHDTPHRLVVPEERSPGLSEHGLGSPAQGLLLILIPPILPTQPATQPRRQHAVIPVHLSA